MQLIVADQPIEPLMGHLVHRRLHHPIGAERADVHDPRVLDPAERTRDIDHIQFGVRIGTDQIIQDAKLPAGGVEHLIGRRSVIGQGPCPD
jgi:hypothetical protein